MKESAMSPMLSRASRRVWVLALVAAVTVSCTTKFPLDIIPDAGADPDASAPTDSTAPPDSSMECGNDVLDAGEECDDGNTLDGDGCDAQCNLEPGALDCETFDSGFTLDAQLRTHADWFYEASSSGPVVSSNIGVDSSVGLTNGVIAFAWVAHPFNWNDGDLISVTFQMDYQTDGSGAFNDDRLGWTISDSDDSSNNIFGVQMDPGGGGAGGNIEAYWDGDTFGDDDGRASIVDLPALAGNAWYRLRATFTKLTATSARINVWLFELDNTGAEISTVVTGELPDTDALADTPGNAIPNAAYFTATTMWPVYKNVNGTDGAADNTCFGVERQ